MTRINLVLLLAVLASALYLVSVQYESRRLFTAIDRAQAEAARQEVEADRLQLEKRSQATPLRVEKLAKQQLQMGVATPAITHYVSHPASFVAKASAGAGSAAAPGRESRGLAQ